MTAWEWPAYMEEANCTDCRWNTIWLGEFYAVHNDVWERASCRKPRPHMLCIGCLEERLGRQLKPNDFTDAPINDPALPNTSNRLRNRMRRQVSFNPPPGTARAAQQKEKVTISDGENS